MSLAISMVMCQGDATLSAEAIQRWLRKKWPDLPRATETDENIDSIAFNLGDSQAIIALMPAAIPWSDLEGPCETSLLWKNAAKEVKAHDCHWIVTLSSELEPIEESALLTQITAAVLATCPGAIGAYWGSATLVIPKQIFIEMAEEILPDPPVMLWVDFRVGWKTKTASSGFTAGLAALGHKEFETDDSPEEPSALYDRLMGLTNYILENGPVIKDGHTVGEDANERIRVVETKSAFGHKGKVLRLEYSKARRGR